MNLFRRSMTALLAGILAAAVALSPPALAQTYPTNNPSYTPTAILAAQTLTAAGTVTFQNAGNGTLLIRVAGTNSAMSATVQGTESRATSPTWTTLPAQTVGGARVSTITANGLYRVNVAGFAQVRFSLASLTGTNVIVSASASPATEFVASLPASRATYSAAATITPAASATDILTLTGSATTTVRVIRATCSGTATAIGTGTLVALKRSTANTGGTSAALTATSFDSTNAAAAGAAVSYSANPTTGSLVGNLRSAVLVLTPTATSTIPAAPIVWDFSAQPGEQGIVLRGIAQQFSLNGAGASFPAGASLLCGVTWTEE